MENARKENDSKYLFAVLTVSDTCYNEIASDGSGPCLSHLLRIQFPNSIIETKIVPDSRSEIEKSILAYIEKGVNVVLTTGGTGFSPRDVTPEATRAIIERECPQLTLAMALESFHKTPFAALSRAVSGIASRTLIINFPGSVKAVQECFEAIKNILPHAINLICDESDLIKKEHNIVQGVNADNTSTYQRKHICPHKTGSGDDADRNSPYPMLPVKEALNIIFSKIRKNPLFVHILLSSVDIPPFRASVKDGYAVRSSSLTGTKKVVGYIAAGDEVIEYDLQEDECFKINTGAPLPTSADCVIQIEDTILHKRNSKGLEELVEILVEPSPGLDVRPIGCDLQKGTRVFPTIDFSPIVMKSICASIGKELNNLHNCTIAIVSTGSELLPPSKAANKNKIFDSNTTMLKELLHYFNFNSTKETVVGDSYDDVKNAIERMFEISDFVICSGGVSMGDKDYIKPVLKELGFEIHFGRVNMKPGKPMTFASKGEKYFFGLPGNPVSAFVTFHLFVLPSLRWYCGWDSNKCELAKIQVKIANFKLDLDSRPEYARASVTSRNGDLHATIKCDQMSSRLQSIVGADVLLHLPSCSETKKYMKSGDVVTASVLRYDFISNYE